MESGVDEQQSLFSEQEMDQLQDPDISVTEVTETKINQVVHHRKAQQFGLRTAFSKCVVTAYSKTTISTNKWSP